MDNYVTACEECNRGKHTRDFVLLFHNWEDRLKYTLRRYNEYGDLFNRVERNMNTLKDEIVQLLRENMPNYKVINEKTGEVFSGENNDTKVWITGSVVRVTNNDDCNLTKICDGVNTSYGGCNGFTGRGICGYIHNGNRPTGCPLTLDEFIKLHDIPSEGLLDIILSQNQYICTRCYKPVPLKDKRRHEC